MNNPLLRTNKIVCGYGDKPILNEISIELFSGELSTVVGPSGCGKSTLLLVLAGLLDVTSGDLFNLSGESIKNHLPVERKISIVFQDHLLFPYKNIYDNIAYPLRLKGLNEGDINDKTQSALSLIGLSAFSKCFPDNLSGGMKQRVSIARSLVMDSELLLLDEPFSALDPQSKFELQNEIIKIQQQLGMSILLVTHDQEEALTLGQRVMLMRNGEVIRFDTPKNILRSDDLFTKSFIRNHVNAKLERLQNLFR